MKNKVVFVLSHIYSGSTWLSLLLGSHSKAFYLGEINKLYSRSDFMSCSLCDEMDRDCTYFNDVKNIYYVDIHNAIAERTNAQVLIDNSKRIKWSRKLLRDDRYEHKYIHIVKDPRAIYYSLLKRNRPADVEHWAKRNMEIGRFLNEFSLDKITLPYNVLAENLDTSLTRLDQWLDLTFEPEQKQYWKFEHHGPGDNSATKSFLQTSKSSDNDFYKDSKKKKFHRFALGKRILSKILLSRLKKTLKCKGQLEELQLKFIDTGLQNLHDTKFKNDGDMLKV